MPTTFRKKLISFRFFDTRIVNRYTKILPSWFKKKIQGLYCLMWHSIMPGHTLCNKYDLILWLTPWPYESLLEIVTGPHAHVLCGPVKIKAIYSRWLVPLLYLMVVAVCGWHVSYIRSADNMMVSYLLNIFLLRYYLLRTNALEIY